MNILYKLFANTAPSDRRFNLSFLRMIVFSAILIESIMPGNNCVWFAQLPNNLHPGLIGYGASNWLLSIKDHITPLYWAFLLCCICSILGLKSRYVMPATTLLAIITLGISHLYDFKNAVAPHHHHLIWFAAILSISKSYEVFSIDSCGKKSLKTSKLLDENLSFNIILFLLGLIFFFPGVFKLIDWGIAENASVILQRIIIVRYQELNLDLPTILVKTPMFVFHFFAVSTIFFEIAFPFLLFGKKTKTLALILALIFHFGTWLVLKISFWPLWVCYFALFNYSCFASRAYLLKDRETKTSYTYYVLVVSVILPNLYCGIFKIHSWPFSAYPTFPSTHYVVKNQTIAIELNYYSFTNKKLEWNQKRMERNFGRLRWHNLSRVVFSGNKLSSGAVDLVEYIAKMNPDLLDAKYVEIFDSNSKEAMFNYSLKKETDHN